jgi:hypothetical protein
MAACSYTVPPLLHVDSAGHPATRHKKQAVILAQYHHPFSLPRVSPVAYLNGLLYTAAEPRGAFTRLPFSPISGTCSCRYFFVIFSLSNTVKDVKKKLILDI